MSGRLSGLFTRDERAVVVFIAMSLAVGSAIMAARRIDPGLALEVGEAPADTAAEEPPAPDWPLDLNSAAESELLELPGVGPARAAAIVKLRESRGGFRSVEDLLEVKGIGPKTLERLKPLATVGPREGPARGSQDGGGGP